MQINLFIKPEEGNAIKIQLKKNSTITLGRSGEKSDIVVKDRKCSGKHCQISFHNNIVAIKDLNSKNGIQINGIKTLEGYLKIGDKLKIGDTLIYIDKLSIPEDKVDVFGGKIGAHANRETTFIVDTTIVDSGNEDLKRKKMHKHQREIVKKHAVAKQIQKEQDLKEKKIQRMSNFELRFFTFMAFLVDMTISILIFFSGIIVFKLQNARLFSVMHTKLSPLEIIFHDSVLPYTAISTILTLIFYFKNANYKNGSLGKRIFKINF